MLSAELEKALLRTVHHPGLLEVMDYAVLPAGKLFRPRLVLALSQDLNLSNESLHLGSAIELHHAYTLVHDDLPSMDNDLIRRGKPSTHAQFGEWKAVLGGDALLISSFQELLQIQHVSLPKILRLFAWATGAKGLIAGQFMDLSTNGSQSLSEILRIHELKTARLIQIATMGSYFLSSKTQSLRNDLTFMRLGRDIGVSFQLLDDLSELTDKTVSPHEKMVNPFLKNPTESFHELIRTHASLQKSLSTHKLSALESMLKDYFQTSRKNLMDHQATLKQNVRFNDWEKFFTSFA